MSEQHSKKDTSLQLEVVQKIAETTKLDMIRPETNKANTSSPDQDNLIVDVEGFQGPLDVLLTLARSQKVDLSQISILELAQQYLLFIAEARKYRLELAADYLVMASWLAYLKSKLLLPKEQATEEDEPSAEEMAKLLAFRLQKLNAMRDAAAKLMAKNCLGRDVFTRGMPENIRVIKTPKYAADMYELIKAYAFQRQNTGAPKLTFESRTVWSVKEACERLERMLGISLEWFPMDHFLYEFIDDASTLKSVKASTFGASLELARSGEIELKQSNAFQPIFLRRKENEKA